MEGNGTETNIYSIAPSLANDAHCSHTNKIKQCCITVGFVRRKVCLNVVIHVTFVGNVLYMFNCMYIIVCILYNVYYGF